MSIQYFDQEKVFMLNTAGSSYVIQVFEGGYVLHTYYGASISDPITNTLVMNHHSGFHTNSADVAQPNHAWFSPDLAMTEYPTRGCGDMRIDAFCVKNKDGNTATDLRYTTHRIFAGKEPIPGIPSLYLTDKAQADTLEIDTVDAVTGVKVTLIYNVFADYNVICRRVRVENTSEYTVILENVKSGCVDFPTPDFDLIHLWGDWGKERTMERVPLMNGIQTVASNRGVSGHAHNPFVALVGKDCTEERGEAFGFHLVYSGNFEIHTEVSAYQSTRLVMGIGEKDFAWVLKPTETFDSPEMVMVYSGAGLGEMSRTLHSLYTQHLISPHWNHTKRPLLINSWEAAYFDFDDEKLLDFARRAKEMGIEMLVMDDGWFGKRNNDACSLGDWYVNENKLHGGLRHLIDRIHALGMKFGIWYEPEMISPDSDLYRAHPDWCIHVPGRKNGIARNQYVLDVSRKDVRDQIWGQIYDVLSKNPVDYVKWDFNRNLTDIGSAALDAAHQGEVCHRFILGTYDLMNRLVTTFPDLLLENCSGGGGRFDPAMLYYSPQIWTSDNTDPIERLTIQFGTSLCYPAATMGAHVSACTRSGVETKGNVAAWGTHGYELDPNRYTDEERELVQKQVTDYHKFYHLTHEGDLYRLMTPTENPYWCAWEVVSQDQSEALVTVVNMRLQPTRTRYLKVHGLDPKKQYRLESPNEMLDGVVCYGNTLMGAGLNLNTYPMYDATSYKIHIREVL